MFAEARKDIDSKEIIREKEKHVAVLKIEVDSKKAEMKRPVDAGDFL
jgi:hypothetical protein